MTLPAIPSLAAAKAMLEAAESRNPGPWVSHSMFTAQAASLIANRVPGLDPSRAYILGLLHDIGRREGVTDMRHILDGYHFLTGLGFPGAARICLTHSFPIKQIEAASGVWDCSITELDFIRQYLTHIEYDAYDRLIQLCDCLAMPDGYCLMEKRLVDVAIRRGVNNLSVEKWKAYLSLRVDFEQAAGGSIYQILPGVIENTFKFG